MNMIVLQKGIALIQVLLITAILSVLVLYFTQTSRQQVALAIYADVKAKAAIHLENSKNNIVFALLTDDRNQTKNISLDKKLKWNFYGKPFAIDNSTTATIQDISGLLPIHFLDRELFLKILISNGIELNRATHVYNLIMDWQDYDTITSMNENEESKYGYTARNGYILDITDLSYIDELTQQELEIINQSYSVFYPGFFNPTLAPDPLLKSILTEAQFQQILSMRDGDLVNNEIFTQVTGIKEAEDLFFAPSNLIKLQLNYFKDDTKLDKTWIIQLDPYAVSQTPVNFLHIRG